jgi:hypothetical protein
MKIGPQTFDMFITMTKTAVSHSGNLRETDTFQFYVPSITFI